MFFAGPPKSGKSFVLLNLIVALALGLDWLGFPCACCRVLYINLEIAHDDLCDRLTSIAEGLNKNVLSRRLDVWNLRGYPVTIEDIYEKLLSWCQTHTYDVIVIDPIYKCLDGDENCATDAAKFMGTIDKIIEAVGCSVIMSHHFSKSGGSDMNAYAGSNVFLRDADAILMLAKSNNSDIRTLKGVLRNYKDFPDMQLCFDAPFFRIVGTTENPTQSKGNDAKHPTSAS